MKRSRRSPVVSEPGRSATIDLWLMAEPPAEASASSSLSRQSPDDHLTPTDGSAG